MAGFGFKAPSARGPKQVPGPRKVAGANAGLVRMRPPRPRILRSRDYTKAGGAQLNPGNMAAPLGFAGSGFGDTATSGES